ncbi:MAG: phosphotransferase [Patescibacteria group bacterium]|nr:phosphotransferase [Patescibacteria group bacterium]
MTCISRKKLLGVIQKNYDIPLHKSQTIRLENSNQGYMNTCIQVSLHNPTQTYIAIIYNRPRYSTDQSRIILDDAYKAAKYLHDHGLPCRIPILTKRKKRLIKFSMEDTKSEHIMGLYNFLPGNTLPWESYTRRHLRALGKCMAEMHRLLKDFPHQTTSLPRWSDYLRNDYSKLKSYFQKNSPAIKKKLSLQVNIKDCTELTKSLHPKSLHPKSHEQTIHYDFVRGNILFSSEKHILTYPITGILDFEKAMIASTAVDIARTLSFLLVDCKYKSDQEIITYFLKEGYVALGKANSPRFDQLNNLMIYFWLRDLWKFLTGNPYNDLHLNYHYTETVRRLAKTAYITLI